MLTSGALAGLVAALLAAGPTWLAVGVASGFLAAPTLPAAIPEAPAPAACDGWQPDKDQRGVPYPASLASLIFSNGSGAPSTGESAAPTRTAPIVR